MSLFRIRSDIHPLDKAPGIRLHHGTAMAAAAVVLALVLNAANLPAPLYVVYKQRFGFSELTLTLVFAVYVVGSIAAMTFLGKVSDYVGRRPVLFAGIALAALGTLIFLFTFNVTTLFAARIVTGLSVGLTGTACVAWIAELQPQGDQGAAARMTTAATMMGLGLGPLIAGLVAEFAPYPLRLPFLIYLVGLIPPALVVWTVHETVKHKRPLTSVPLTPQLSVPSDIAILFGALAATGFVAFSMMGFYSALIPSLLANSLHIESHAAGGAVIFFMFVCGTIAIALSLMWSSRVSTYLGLALIPPGVALLVAAQHFGSLALLLAASAIGGASGALGFCGSLQVVNEIAPAGRRAAVVSSLLVICYGGLSLPVIGIGVLTAASGAGVADLVFAIVLCALAAIAAGICWRYLKER
ncbi:MAG TPA: MFS transporter [Pseudolabrys sp.]|nr:MFS transporter [Pseudolabrys sp.]